MNVSAPRLGLVRDLVAEADQVVLLPAAVAAADGVALSVLYLYASAACM